MAFRPDAAEDCSAEFKQLYAEELQTNPGLGAAIRWAIQAKDDKNLRLILQALPATADRLRVEPRLYYKYMWKTIHFLENIPLWIY